MLVYHIETVHQGQRQLWGSCSKSYSTMVYGSGVCGLARGALINATYTMVAFVWSRL
jgi:hypothetical protein